ncbi:MAG: DUF2259 domain-containing protein [Roseibium sp.]|uniref:DUF2259 domain-containing protein n=1 Tax=Roseibium sp. TaxID=1936156 RepID=UPI003D9C2367
MPNGLRFTRTIDRVLVCLLPVLAFIGIATASARAGDTAELEIYGFSSHGDFFAFEQYGWQDGSGFPYSEIFVLDVRTDSWVKPSPFRRVDEVDEENGYDPEDALAETRTLNQKAAHALLDKTSIFGMGKTVAFNPATELGSNPYHIKVAPRLPLLAGETSLDLALTEFPLENAECAGYGVETKGFQLTMTANGVTRTLNNDTSVPKSRRCPFSYRIERVFTFYPEKGPAVFAIFVQMESLGFEGPDRRYLAITGRL